MAGQQISVQKKMKVIISASHFDDAIPDFQKLIFKGPSIAGLATTIDFTRVESIDYEGWKNLMKFYRFTGKQVILINAIKKIRKSIEKYCGKGYFECKNQWHRRFTKKILPSSLTK